MKNKKLILFMSYVLLVMMGFSGNYINQLVDSTYSFITQFSFSAMIDYKYSIESIADKQLRYHDDLLTLNSIRENILKTRIVTKPDSTIIKTKEGILIEGRSYISNESMDESVDQIYDLYECAKTNSSNFLYIAAPTAGNFMTVPENYKDYTRSNYDRYIKRLNNKGIPTLDLQEVILQEGLVPQELYFYTDHHWKPKTGLWAANKVCEILNDKYGYQYDSELIDIENYDNKQFNDLFLGSLGKKVGLFFTWYGADDFDILTPRFNTIFSENIGNNHNQGDFEHVMLHDRFLENKGYYKNSAYGTYNGGDFRLQILKNHNITGETKALIIRDSYACVVTPFLAQNMSELHVVDVRDGDWIEGEKFNVHNYIEQIQPDYVLVLYSEAGGGKRGRNDFKNEYSKQN